MGDPGLGRQAGDGPPDERHEMLGDDEIGVGGLDGTGPGLVVVEACERRLQRLGDRCLMEPGFGYVAISHDQCSPP
jgi:hypothetical protein